MVNPPAACAGREERSDGQSANTRAGLFLIWHICMHVNYQLFSVPFFVNGKTFLFGAGRRTSSWVAHHHILPC